MKTLLNSHEIYYYLCTGNYSIFAQSSLINVLKHKQIFLLCKEEGRLLTKYTQLEEALKCALYTPDDCSQSPMSNHPTLHQ